MTYENRANAEVAPAGYREYVEGPKALRAFTNIPDVAGDHLNAQRFIATYGASVRHSPELGRWYIWDGSWWVEDRLDQIREMAAATIDELRQWVGEADGADEIKRRTADYVSSAKAGRGVALLSLASHDPDIVVAVGDLDAHPQLLACRNGTVDLTTGELRPPQPDALLTRGIDVDYHPAAWSADWEKFITTIFNGDSDLIDFVQRMLGYCITGVVHEHVLPIFHGQGANGKSTLVGIVQDLLGDHAITAPDGLVIRHDHEPHPERIAALRGRRLVVSNELEQQANLAEQAVKMLTGGDTLSARELYGKRFNFTPSHKILLVTNHKPKVRGGDHALWRRIRLVPFDTIIPAEQQDMDLRRRLVHDHGSAVLAWLVQGALNWHSDGLGSSAAVDAATEEYKATQDTFGAFLSEYTVEVPHTRTKVGDLYDQWKAWCDHTGNRPGRQQDFTDSLENHSFVIETYRNAKSVVGLGLSAEQDKCKNG